MSDIINLKNETISVLNKNGKTVEDIVWCGGDSIEIPIDLFWKLADKEYDSGFGGSEVAVDLVIVGKDFWLERHEYDGSEWWEFKTIPIRPPYKRDVRTLFGFHKLENANDIEFWKNRDKEDAYKLEAIKQEELKQLKYLSEKYN